MNICLYNLCHYLRFREAMGMKVVAALKKGDPGVTHAALDALCALLHPMHADYDLRQEQLNKSSLLSSKKFLEGLLDMWTEHVVGFKSFSLLLCLFFLLNFVIVCFRIKVAVH